MSKLKFTTNIAAFVAILITVSCSVLNNDYTKNWQGSDLPGHIYATFDGFNGERDFNAKMRSGGGMNIKYSTDVPAGEMHLEIKCNSKTVLNRDVSGSLRDSIGFDNPGNESVQFIFVAKNAAGKFDLTY